MAIEVSQSWYHVWLYIDISPRQRKLKRDKRDAKVKEAFEARKQRDGPRHIQTELVDNGKTADIQTIADNIRRQHQLPKAVHKFKMNNHSEHRVVEASNLLAHNLTTSAPNQG